MIERLKKMEEVYEELTARLSDPKVIEDQATWRECRKRWILSANIKR